MTSQVAEKSEVNQLKELGDQASQQQTYKEAARHYEKALKMLKRSGNPFGNSEAKKQTLGLLVDLGKTYNILGELDRASRAFQLSLSLGKKLQDNQTVADVLRQVGRIHSQKNSWEEALSYYDQSLKISEESGNLQGIADAYVDMGIVYFERGEWGWVIQFFNRALEIARRLGDLQLIANIYNNFGAMFNIQGIWERAIEYYEKSITIYEEAKDLHGLARTYQNLGMTFADLKEWKKADSCYARSLSILDEIGDEALTATTCLNRAEAYINMARLEDAEHYCSEALKILKDLDDKLGIAEARKLYGIIHRERGEWAESESCFKESIQINKEYESRLGLAEGLRELGLTYRERGEEEKALMLFGESLAIFMELRARSDVEQVDQEIVELETLYLRVVRSMGAAVEAKDPYTLGHSQRVADLAYELGKELELSPDELKGLLTAAYLHDLGKIGIEDAILQKPAELTTEEYEIIKAHPAKGVKALESVEFPWEVKPLILHHHERWDGTGYPDGLKREEIPLGARIIAVIDFFDALTSARPYRPPWSESKALRAIAEKTGTMFDPKVSKSFLRIVEKRRQLIEEPVAEAVA